MRQLAIAALLLAVGCNKNASSTPPPEAKSGDECAHVDTVKLVMKCELAPYASGKLTDPAAFRRALQQLAEVGPSDAAFQPRWADIATQMAQTGDSKQGCQNCHRELLKPYRAKYEDTQIPWVDVHAAK